MNLLSKIEMGIVKKKKKKRGLSKGEWMFSVGSNFDHRGFSPPSLVAACNAYMATLTPLIEESDISHCLLIVICDPSLFS